MAWIRGKGPLGLSFLRAKGVLKGFKERLHQVPLTQMLGVSSRVTPINPGTSPAAGLWHFLEIHPFPAHHQFPFFLLCSPSTDPLPSSLLCPLYHQITSLKPPMISILFPLLRKIQDPPLNIPCSLPSFSLLVVAWLSCTL